MTQHIFITPGDPDGIGPEVTAKALLHLKSKLKKRPIWLFASRKPFRKTESLLKNALPQLQFLEPPSRSLPGFQAGWAIETATRIALRSPSDSVLVTGPIHKMRLQEGGYPFQGHTDLLGHLCQVDAPTMMLANGIFRVSLVTQHCALNQVSKILTRERIEKTILDTAHHLKFTLGIARPHIAVLGLNPHAGESGMLGTEESSVILPAMASAKKRCKYITLAGPLSADSFFGNQLGQKKKADAVIAQYHDQGLIPVKLTGYHQSVNITLGLPIVRVSVDHGTAFDIAGKNRANPESMIFAVETALLLQSRRKKR